MATTFVANMFDTEGNVAESLQRTGDSMAQIWGNASITSFVSVAAEAAVTPKCFVAGTAVVTSVGLVAIEHIKPGDMVLAENEKTGEIAYKEVVRTFTNTTEELTHVTITTEDGQVETIDATPQHPFYVEGKGWVEASALHAGMVVWLADGTKAVVTDVVTEGLKEPVTVYNFEVADFHTYFVGDSGVLVHNSCSASNDIIPNGNNVTIWDDINATADNISGTEIPATFQIKVPEEAGYTNPHTNTSVLWTNANATEHMGEYINRSGMLDSTAGVRSQVLLESYSAALNQAVTESASQATGRVFGNYGNWQLGIDFSDGVVYHARMLG